MGQMIKKFLGAGCLVIVAIIIFISLPPNVLAEGGNELLPAGQTIDSDYFRTGQTVQINGDIHGDAFLSGGVVTMNGKVDGDLFVAGGKVVVNGTVGNSVRIAGGDVAINGTIGRNALIFCGNCNVSHEASISGSLLVAGGNLEVNTPAVGRGFRYFGSRLYLNSIVNSEAFVVANQEFILGPQSSISGNLKYSGNNALVREPGSTVAGTIAYEKVNKNQDFPRFFGAGTIFSAYEKIRPLTDFVGFIISAIVGFILLGLFPRFFEKTTRAIEGQPYASIGWGIIVLLLVPLVAILLAITIVGLPLSILLIVLGYLVWMIAKYMMAFFIGRRILLGRYGERRGWALILGLFLFYLIGLIPVVGNFVKIVLSLFAIGAMVLSYRHPEIIEPRAPIVAKSPLKRQKSLSRK